ncbi:MAG: hypothetical protein R6U96_07615 [Promethearchaeia archaeon]
MSQQKYKEKIVFDANFFICMLSIKARNILFNLHRAAEDLGYDYHISNMVFDEIKASQKFKQDFQKYINIDDINDEEIEKIKEDLLKFNIRFPAQDPDVSLIVLGDHLLKENDASVHLVTDDFKLAKNTNLLYKGKINILSLSSFLLKVQRGITKKQMRNYFKNVWKNSLNYTLSYMIERSKRYPAEDKITWLIERAVSVTEDSIISQDIEIQNPAMQFCIGSGKYAEEFEIAEKYIENQPLPPSEEEEIQNLTNFLENLKISREYLKRAKDAIIKSQTKDSIRFLKKGNGFLVSLLQICSGQLGNQKDYEIMESLICSEISKMEFLRAFLLVSLGKISRSIDSLERAALFSTIIHNYQTCLILNYLKALILLFHGLYKQAIMQYNFTEELADLYKDDKLDLKCKIGKAITMYIQGDQRDVAQNIMEEISTMDLEDNFLDAIIVFSELGDYFLALGHSQIATNLYNEALEIAIDYKLDFKTEILIGKLKRSYIATVLDGYSTEDMMSDKINLLLDKAYSVKDVDKYNEQIKKIGSFNQLLYTDFPYLIGKDKIISYKDMPEGLQEEYLEVVKFEKLNEDKILFIISHYELGLLGIKLRTKQRITGVAENYSLKIKPTARIKIYEPTPESRELYLIRAVVEILNSETCEIKYSLPSFFESMNL